MITEENINDLKAIRDLLIKKVSYFDIEEIEIVVGEDNIYLPMPGDDGFSFTIPEFVILGKELVNFVVHASGRIKTTSFSYQIVKTEDSDLGDYLRRTQEFYSVEDIAEIRIIEANYWIAFACIIIGSYHEYGTGYNYYSVVEIEYQNKDLILDFDKETNLIYSYLFEISDTTGYIFHFSKITKVDVDLMEKIKKLFISDMEDSDENEQYEDEIELKPLLNYSEAMRLYVSALQTTDPELMLLNFYKIFEYFAPIVISIESYEQLSKKLDSPKVLKPDRQYLKSIFDLVEAYKQRSRDSELIKAVINKCFDLVEIFNDLPDSIKKKTLSLIKEKNISYQTSKEKLSQVSNFLGTIIYTTRNKVVHAKSNFSESGDECPAHDIEQLNVFLKKATALTIRWHSKLPGYQKE